MRWDDKERPDDISAWVALFFASTIYVWAVILAQLIEWMVK